LVLNGWNIFEPVLYRFYDSKWTWKRTLDWLLSRGSVLLSVARGVSALRSGMGVCSLAKEGLGSERALRTSGGILEIHHSDFEPCFSISQKTKRKSLIPAQNPSPIWRNSLFPFNFKSYIKSIKLVDDGDSLTGLVLSSDFLLENFPAETGMTW
jgi:hypothetical protein